MMSNMLIFSQIITLLSKNLNTYSSKSKCSKIVGDPTSTRDKDLSLYISGCKPHPMSRFYVVELGLKSTS